MITRFIQNINDLSTVGKINSDFHHDYIFNLPLPIPPACSVTWLIVDFVLMQSCVKK